MEKLLKALQELREANSDTYYISVRLFDDESGCVEVRNMAGMCIAEEGFDSVKLADQIISSLASDPNKSPAQLWLENNTK